jgi:hypothetical protein
MKALQRLKVTSLLMAIVMLATLFVPAVSAKADSSTSSITDKKQVVIEDIPEIEAIEMTDTLNVVKVGDVLIHFESNPEHTEAVMSIENTTTSEKTIVNYKASEVKGKFKTDVYTDGKLVTTLDTNYNLLEPSATKKILSENNKAIASSTDALVTTTKAAPTKYKWDNVNFVKGSGIKYPHPDYDKYSGEVWESWSINGNKLKHCHISDSKSNTIVQSAPAVAGALIGTMGGISGVALGTFLGIAMGNASCGVLLDEEDCLWYWKSYTFTYITVPPGNTPIFVPHYCRVAKYELWDKIGISNP